MSHLHIKILFAPQHKSMIMKRINKEEAEEEVHKSLLFDGFNSDGENKNC